MARVSRKKPQAEAQLAHAPILFKTAGYCRISSEDKDYCNGGTLENQILMIQNYINEAPDLELCSIHNDNGLTGTNFNRPGFEMLMEEIREGKINCIVVKDLSRFGRDYVEAGNFLEVIFPRLGVRFISIGDNYDSFDPRCQGEGITIALKNMINAFYSKDLSTKIRSALATKRQNGEFTGSRSPFGYIKSPENKYKFIIDDEAANIVRIIFKLKLDGMGCYQISRHLTQLKMPTPGYYGYLKGTQKDKRYKSLQPWDASVVRGILENVVYLGHTVMGKTRATSCRGQELVSKEDWVITENTHEPIISGPDFDAVGEMFKQLKEKRDNYNSYRRDELPDNILEGLIFCADCGRTYRRITSVMSDKKSYRFTYNCPVCNYSHEKRKYRHFKDNELLEVIYKAIRQQIDTCVDLRRVLQHINAGAGMKQRKSELDCEIGHIQKRLDRFPSMKLRLYDDYCAGVLDEAEYQLITKQYDDEKTLLFKQLSQHLAQKEQLQPKFIDDNKWVSTVELFMGEKEFTREMLLAFVERIEVGGDLTVHIIHRYQDEYSLLASFIAESEGYLHG